MLLIRAPETKSFIKINNDVFTIVNYVSVLKDVLAEKNRVYYRGYLGEINMGRWCMMEKYYKVYYNVIWPSCGTADDPKFALLKYFDKLIFKVVKVGEEFEGYTPIF